MKKKNGGKETELRCKGREIDGGGGGVEESDGAESWRRTCGREVH